MEYQNDKGKVNKIFVAASVLLIVAGIVSASYYTYRTINKPNVGDLIVNSVEHYNSEDIRSNEVIVDLKINAPNLNNPDLYDPEFTDSFFGAENLDMSLLYSIKSEKDSEGNSTLEGNLSILLNSDSSEGFTINNQKASISFMAFPDTFYFRLNELPTILDVIEMPGLENLKKLVGIWYESPNEVISQMIGVPVDIFTTTQSLNLNEIEEIRNFINAGEIFNVKSFKKTDHELLGKITDIKSNINWDELVNASVNISSAYGVPMSESEIRSLNDSVEQIQNSQLNDMLISFYERNNIIVGLGASGDFKNVDNGATLFEYNFNTAITNINKEFNLQRPQNTKGFMELLSTLLFILI